MVQLAQLPVDVAQVAVRLGRVRGQADGLAAVDQCFPPAVLFEQQLA
jgi:hypothetical protein